MRPVRPGMPRSVEDEDCEERERAPTPERAENGQASCYRGVTWHKATRRWRANIKIKGKKIALGAFDDELQAAKAFDRAALRYRGPKTTLNFSTGEKGATKQATRKAAKRLHKAPKASVESDCSDTPCEEGLAVEIAGLPSSRKYLPMPHITELAELASNAEMPQSLLGISGTKRKRGESDDEAAVFCNEEEGSCTTREMQALNWVRTKIAASAASGGDSAKATPEPTQASKGEDAEAADAILGDHLPDILSYDCDIFQLIPAQTTTAMDVKAEQLWANNQTDSDADGFQHMFDEDHGQQQAVRASMMVHCQPKPIDIKAFAVMTDAEKVAHLQRPASGDMNAPTASGNSEPTNSANSTRTGTLVARTGSDALDSIYQPHGSQHAKYEYFAAQGCELQPQASLSSQHSPAGSPRHAFHAHKAAQGGRTAEQYREILIRASLANAIEPPMPQAMDCMPVVPAVTFSDSPSLRPLAHNIWWRQQLAFSNPFLLAKMAAFNAFDADFCPFTAGGFGMRGFRAPANPYAAFPMFPAAMG